MNIHLALAGNPNSGKTTLFNRLTGTRQTTGNWPGVTIEKKVGVIRRGGNVYTLVDLPGIYSLSPFSIEEIVTRNYILEDRPDVIVNILDATNLERNLYLTLQLKKLGRPMVVALNMMDAVELSGDQIDLERLSDRIGLRVIPISAKRNQGIALLIDAVRDLAVAVGHHDAYHHHILSEQPYGIHREHDHSFDQPDSLAHVPSDFKPDRDEDIQQLYQQAAAIRAEVLAPKNSPEAFTKSDKIDYWLTHRLFALPIFILVMFAVFQVTFHEKLGGQLTTWLDSFFSGPLSQGVSHWLLAAQAPDWIRSLLVDGIIAGVGGVLTFLPQISLLFLFLSILEDTGYMARTAFMVDRLFMKFGLSGRSFIPMLMGFGCTVPAVMAARSLDSERDRRLTILITPFMSCGARMPIYAFFASIFFSAHKGLVTFSMYLLGILVALLTAVLFTKTVLKGQESSFLIEMPPYRLPDIKSLGLRVWDKIKDFIIRAGTLIFTMSIVIWALQNFTLSLQPAQSSSASIFGQIGGIIAPVFKPTGFGDWQAAVALLTGLIAKEAVVAALGILYTPDQITAAFTPLSAYAFMTFTLLYTPCVAALGAIAREMHSWRWTVASVAYQLGVAYAFALIVFQIGRVFGFGG